MEKITVIVPVYNVASFLERALKSITCQTYTNLQILLIDDGSTDESGKICDDWVKKDRRMQVYLLREIMDWILQLGSTSCL